MEFLFYALKGTHEDERSLRLLKILAEIRDLANILPRFANGRF